MQAGSDDREVIQNHVKNAQNGDPVAFAALYERYFDQILRYVSFKTGNSSDAEDIAGEVFVKMLESIHSFRWQGHPFSSWLFRIAHNLIVDYFRRMGRKKTVTLDDVEAKTRATTLDIDEYVDKNLTLEKVDKAMEGLTNLQREVISLRFAAGLSVAETARAVGKKENAVKALQHAGVKKLRDILNPQASGSVVVAHPEV